MACHRAARRCGRDGAGRHRSTGGASRARASSGSITVWVDAVRLPAAKAYVKAHPKVKVKIVTYDGDGNGATTLQAKIQLWNRTGKGWPDVIFSEQANDPVWMASKPFEFAAPVKGLIPAKILSKWPAPSRGQCTVNGREICVQDNLAQTVLWYDKTLMDKFGYTVPTTWQEWAALGQKVATEHPGYIIGNTGDSYSHWTYLWADQCPLSQVQKNGSVRINSTDSHCTRMASLLDPLIKNGIDAAGEHLHAGLRPEVRRSGPEGPDDAGADLVREGRLQRHAEDPGRAHGGGHAAAVERRVTDHDRPDRRRSVDHLEALQEHPRPPATSSPGSRRRRSSRTRARVTRPTRPPPRAGWRTSARTRTSPRARQSRCKQPPGLIWKGWSMVTYPDQPVWSNTVVTQLVGRQVAELTAAGARRRARKGRAGGWLQGRQAMTT